jgi:Trypsin
MCLTPPALIRVALHQGVFEGRVLVGAYRRGTTEGGAEWRSVQSYMQVHPGFDQNSFSNDVMLFKIAPSNATPVVLNTDPGDPAPGANLTTAGFGLFTTASQAQPAYLLKADVQSLEDDVCNTLIEYELREFPDAELGFRSDVMTCTMGITSDGSPKGPCQGTARGC